MEEDLKNNHKNKEENSDFPGYPMYPSTEDIYNQLKEETEIDPEQTDKKKSNKKEPASNLNEKDFKEDVSGSDLDVPGAELDDEQEEIGSEDEENNIYSLGDDEEE